MTETIATPVKCERCHERVATEIWCESQMAYIHGFTQQWCKRCVLTAQLAHAEAMAANIPELRAALAAEGPFSDDVEPDKRSHGEDETAPQDGATR